MSGRIGGPEKKSEERENAVAGRNLAVSCVIDKSYTMNRYKNGLSSVLRPARKWKVRMDYNSSCNLIALRDAKPKRTQKCTVLMNKH